jgi:hypothetical protein
LTSRLLLEVRYANRGESFGNLLPPEGDVWRSLIPVFEQSTAFQYRGRGGDGGVSGLFGFTAQNINNAVANMSYVTGSHSLKVGFSDTWSTTDSSSNSNASNLYFRFNNGVPNQLTMYGTPTTGTSKVLGEVGVFVQDRWTRDRMTVNAGVRYDQFRGGYPDQHLGPAMFQPTRDLTFPGVTGIDVKDVTPRIGMSYDLHGNGKTAVKVNLGKYPLGVSTIGNPAGITNTVTRTWTDANGNFSPDCNLLNLQSQDLRTSGGDFCGIVSSLNFGLPTSVTKFNNDTRFGWGTRAYNWEFSTSVQHQIAPRVAVDVGYFRRWFGNFQTTQNLLTSSSDYSPYSFLAPLDPRLPDGGGFLVSGLYDLNPNKSGQVDNYTTMAADFGKQIEHWNGVDASVNARLEHGILLQGGFSVGRTIMDNCEIRANSGGNPSQRFCHTETDLMGQTQVKLLGTYLVPKVDVNIAATFQSTPGPGIAANYIALNSLVQPSLGRPLSGSAPSVTVNLIEPGKFYGDRANQLDVRFSKIFRFAKRRANLNLDLYNLMNANPVMQENASFAVWRTPQRIMDARLFKISAQFEF